MRILTTPVLLALCLLLTLCESPTFARGFGGGFHGGGGFRGGMGGGFRGGMGGGYRGGYGGGGFRAAGPAHGSLGLRRPGYGAGMRGNASLGRGSLGGPRPAGMHPGGMRGTGAMGHANRSGSFSHPSYASRFGGERGGMANRGRGETGNRAIGNRTNVGNRTGIGNHNFNGNTFNIGNRNLNLAGRGYRPSYYNHGFYHGYWNGHYGLGWGWGGGYWWRPWYWGYGGWGLGMLMYESGYTGYSNPYYYSGGGTTNVYNYSQPIPVNYNTPGATADSAVPTASNDSDALQPAIDAFQKGNFDRSLDLVNALIRKNSSDAVFHEFRALVLFARGDYQEAAATIHSVLAVGPGWDWTTLSHLYANIQDYHDQLSALERFVQAHDSNGSAHFLLAYHYLTEGHPDPAVDQLKKVMALVPEDKVAADLVKMLSPPPSQTDSATGESPLVTAPPPSSPEPAAQPVDPMSLKGAWTASRDDGSKFELLFGENNEFTWNYSRKEKNFTFGGTWQVEGDLLTLERKDGGSMIGTIKLAGDGSFQMHMLGEPEEDPGLTFRRQ